MTGRVQKGKHGSPTLVAPSIIANVKAVKMFVFRKLVYLNKRPGRGADPPPPSTAEVLERVELYSTHPKGLRSL